MKVRLMVEKQLALNKGRMGDSTGDFEVQVTFETSSSNGVKIKYVSLDTYLSQVLHRMWIQDFCSRGS